MSSRHGSSAADISIRYADVTHEVELVRTGSRWALVYNLVNTSTHSTLSAGILDSQMSVFLDILNQWKAWEARLPALVHPLSYQYTANGLISARLKGNDFHLAKRVMQGCARDGQICVLLANMEVQLTDSNGEDDSSSQTDEKIFLEHEAGVTGLGGRRGLWYASSWTVRVAASCLTRRNEFWHGDVLDDIGQRERRGPPLDFDLGDHVWSDTRECIESQQHKTARKAAANIRRHQCMRYGS
ncbi:hypothetical protein LTS01_024343 [Friedmanniomyces endolithicus]|nr:hypothetical protein LTS01_024343 [Friedmanniomyces endolithicus]